MFNLIEMLSGWQKVVVCDKCGYIHSLAFTPSVCPKCAGDFFPCGVGKDAHMEIARKKLFGWEFLNEKKP